MPTYNTDINRTDVAGLVPVEYSNEIARGVAAEQSAVMRLGRRLRDMARYQTKLPVMSALATAYFVSGDTGLKQTSEVNWQDVTITAEELAVIVPIPQAVLDDSSAPIWDMVLPDIQTALGQAIDMAVLFGTNKPASWPAAIVTAANSAGNAVAIGTGADLYEDILGENGVVAKIEADGFMMSGSIAHMTMRGKLRGVRTTDGQLIFQPSMQTPGQYTLDGAPILFPTNGAMNSSYPLIVGQWDQLVYSIRQDMNWKVFDTGVIQDGSGVIVYNLLQQDMVALRVTMRLGFAVPNPANRVQPSSGNRYPFGVLTV
ncbi:MAG: phage major capsid protein [Anaerolineae bacterium]|nr:phage major capsid protein [Anaerolineae bacterium]